MLEEVLRWSLPIPHEASLFHTLYLVFAFTSYEQLFMGAGCPSFYVRQYYSSFPPLILSFFFVILRLCLLQTGLEASGGGRLWKWPRSI